MSKRKYRATKIQAIDHTKLSAELGDGKVIVAIDVAKTKFYAAIVGSDGAVRQIVKWTHPAESGAFMALVGHLGGAQRVQVVLEPSGVYGDAIRAALDRAGIPVFRVSPKRVHDAAEVFDGVPSLHDAKAATVIAKLHLLDGLSERWPFEPEHRRRLAAQLRILDLHDKEVRRNLNRLEALLSRYWPEAESILSTESATMLEVLIEFGGPGPLERRQEDARKLMQKVGGHFLSQAKIDALLGSVTSSWGVPQLEEELELVREVASEIRRHQKATNRARVRIEKLSLMEDSVTKAIAPVVGRTTSAVLVAGVGDPRQFHCPAAYVKALGLNLKIYSSGDCKKGELHITKRGPSVVRRYLYLAVMRMVQRDPVVQAWYAQKVSRDAGRKQKALIALMRKLASALWHVAHGAAFDSCKLFDATRLELAPAHDEVSQPSSP